jgi:hypothetical protein
MDQLFNWLVNQKVRNGLDAVAHRNISVPTWNRNYID